MKQTWDLNSLFSGGSQSKELAQFLAQIEQQLPKIQKLELADALLLSQEVQRDFAEARSFINCLAAQDVKDLKAKELQSKIASLSAELEKVKIQLDDQLKCLSEKEFEELFDEKLSPIRFVLQERRNLAKKRLPMDKEALIEDLSVDGYHAWSNYHNTLVDSMTFPFRGENFSQGQIENQFSKSDPSVRKEAFSTYASTYKQYENHFGAVLNHIGGFRLKMYQARGWKKVTEEPCDYNRMSQETLDTMWKVVAENRAPLIQFLEAKAKAKLLGVEKLSWFDLEAPLGQEKGDIPYEQGASFIINHFGRVSPKMAQFAKEALESSWVEAEDRKNKQPGGFCTSFPKSLQSRIFMTYSNTLTNVEVLAHELGHAFHTHCCYSLPYFNQNYSMNVAETASTMAEMIVADAAYKAAETDEERLSLLNNKLSRSVAYLMNLHARFEFENKFYEERAHGFVSPERLSEIMIGAQKEAYSNSLEEYHPLFWASKLHFYLTSVPFYNFPYTFGYLFSLGIYRELMKDPSTFEEKYIALLQDTARMSTEDLASKHLGVDLTQPSFWKGAVDAALEDVALFVELAGRAPHTTPDVAPTG